MKNTDASTGDWLLLITPAVIWGASYLFIAEALAAIGPNGVTFLRIAIGFATLSLFRASRAPIDRADWRAVALLGFVWFAFPLSMFPFAELHVSSAVTGMLGGATPLFTAIVTSSLARRLPSRGILAGLAVGLTGIVLIALPTLGEGHSSGLGVLLVLAAVVSYGFALPVAQPLQQKYGALPVLWRAQLVALLLTAPLGIIEIPRAHWTPAPLASILMLGAFGTGAAFVMMATAAGRLGSTRAAGAVFLTPGVALALGVIVRGERVALVSVFGSVVAVAGAWLMRRAQANEPLRQKMSMPPADVVTSDDEENDLRRSA
jgi:drug/metabolite transporter (DMT)-like permease